MLFRSKPTSSGFHWVRRTRGCTLGDRRRVFPTVIIVSGAVAVIQLSSASTWPWHPQLTEDDNELSSHHPHRPRQTISNRRRQSHVKFYSETAPIEKCDRNWTDLMYDTCLLSHPNLLTTRSKEATAYRCYEDALRYRKGVV